MTQTTKLHFGVEDWVRQTEKFNDQPPSSYAHKHFCFNCGRQNYFYIRKGTEVRKADLICENCGVQIS